MARSETGDESIAPPRVEVMNGKHRYAAFEEFESDGGSRAAGADQQRAAPGDDKTLPLEPVDISLAVGVVAEPVAIALANDVDGAHEAGTRCQLTAFRKNTRLMGDGHESTSDVGHLCERTDDLMYVAWLDRDGNNDCIPTAADQDFSQRVVSPESGTSSHGLSIVIGSSRTE
jgi:hypothetical protein